MPAAASVEQVFCHKPRQTHLEVLFLQHLPSRSGVLKNQQQNSSRISHSDLVRLQISLHQQKEQSQQCDLCCIKDNFSVRSHSHHLCLVCESSAEKAGSFFISVRTWLRDVSLTLTAASAGITRGMTMLQLGSRPLWRLLVAMVVLLVQALPALARLDVNLHAIIPNHVSWSEDQRRLLFTKQTQMYSNRRLSRMRMVFRVNVNVTFLKQDNPREILDMFCRDIFPANTTAILHINNPLSIRRRTAARTYLLELATHFGIPLISWDSEFFGSAFSNLESRTLQIAPTVLHQTEAMMALLNRYNWTQFSIVTSLTAGYQDFAASLRTMAKNSQNRPQFSVTGQPIKRFKVLVEVVIRNTTDQEHLRDQLNVLHETESRVILLHSDSLESKYIMDCVHEMNLAGPEFVWILTQTAIPRAMVAAHPFHLGVLGIGYEHGEKAMEEAIKVGVATWADALNELSNTKSVLTRMSMPPALTCNSTEKTYWQDGGIFYDFLKKVVDGGPPRIEYNEEGMLTNTELNIINVQKRGEYNSWVDVGKWTRHGLEIQDITWPGEAPGPPRGKPERHYLRIVTLKEEPYVTYRDPDPTCPSNAVLCRVYERAPNKTRLSDITVNKCCVGLAIDLLLMLSNELEFDFDLFEVADGLWGAPQQGTDNWNGLIRELMDKKADMCITSLKITPERNSVVDFSMPYLETGITIIVALREGAISPTAFLEPYDYPSWCLILVFSVHATGASIFIFEWLSPYGLNQGLSPLREHKFSLFRSFWLIWSMLFGAAVSTDTPRGVSSRFLANIWALFALVFLASYTANLAAFMITKEEYYDLSGIKDWRLTNPYSVKPPFKYATVPDGSTETNIKNNQYNMYVYMKMYNKPTVEEGVSAVKSGEIQAFIYDATVLQYRAGRDEACRLITVGNWYAATGYGVAFPRGSPWKEKVDKIILELQDKGDTERLRKFWLAGACQKKEKNKQVKSHTLGILNFTSAFILLAGGMLLCTLLLALEHLYFQFGRKRLKKMDKCGCCALVSLSMGKSLTLEESVREAIQSRRRRRCTDPWCETQLWKIKHELDLALLKVDRLQGNDVIEEEKPEDLPVRVDLESVQTVVPRQPNGITRPTSPERVEHLDMDSEVGDLLLRRGSEDTRSEGGGTPRSRVAFRRSPSYATAMNECGSAIAETQKPKTRVLDGKYYLGVSNDADVESML